MKPESRDFGTPEGADFEVDFGDAAPLPAAQRTTGRKVGSAPVHPADEEWNQPDSAVEPLPDTRHRKVPYVNGVAPSRSLPNSIEAEEYLLACCFIDGRDVIARCLEAKIAPESFFDTRHGIIYECLLSAFNRKIDIDISTIAEELKVTKELEVVGGYSFLMQITSRIPTTAQAGYFIEKVKELSLLRDTIRTATAIVENAHNFSGGIEDFLKEQKAKFDRVFDGSAISREELITERSFNINRQIDKPEPIYTLAGTTICTPGNLTAIYSQAKTGKSSVEGAMLAAAMTNPTSGCDTLGFVGPNYAKKAVLHFDTEQSPYDWQQLVKSSLKRAKLPEPPPWLRSYNLTGMSARDCRAFVKACMKRDSKRFGGIHSVHIDGIADLVVDPNDAEECFPLITELHGEAITYNTAIVVVLHMNPGAETKGRGHLGSQLERKTESNITLEKTGEITRVWSTKQRGKAISKDKAPAFKWSDDDQMHRSCPTPDSDEPESKAGRPEKYTFADFRNIFPEKSTPGLDLGQLHRLLISNKDIKKQILHNVLKRWAEEGTVEIIEVKGQPMRYRKAL